MGSRGRQSAAALAALRIVPESTPAALVRQPPPTHLSPAMQSWWCSVVEDYELDRHHLHLLEAACGAWDRMTQARAAIDEKGLTFIDKGGDPRVRPEVSIERDARTAFTRVLRELDLDLAPPPEPRGRPPGLRSNRR